MKNTGKKSESKILRQKAEYLLKKKSSRIALQPSEVEMTKLIHEFEVHQVELEMQNEEIIFAKQKAETAAEKYSVLFDFAPSGYFTLSKEGLILEMNLSGSKMLGKERSYLRKKLFVFYLSKDSKPIFNLFFKKVFDSKIKETCEVTLSTKGTSPMTVHLTGIAIENGEQCLVSMTDITASMHMKALHESEEKLRISQLYTRSLIEASPDPLVTINMDGKILDLNLATETATGFFRTNLIGTDFSDYFTEPDKAKTGYQRVFKDGYIVDYQLTIRHASGKLIDVLYNANVFKDEHGKILGVFAAARDITKLKQAEKKLRISEETHRSLFEISLQGIVHQDSEGKIVNANPAAQRILGLTLDQMQGRTSFHPDWRAMKEDGSDFPGEEHPAIVSLRTRKVIQNVIMGVFNPIDEIVHWIKVSASPLFSEGKSAPYMVFTVFEDITVEEEIKRKNEQLFQVNAEKDKFFSIIAHDLRGPFNGFLGLSKMMAEDLPALTLEQVQKMASGMRDSATNLFRLLENLLEWSRLQRDITPFEPESFLLMCMMTESMRPVMDSANKKEIEISYEIPGDLEVFADENMLASTLRNLTSNAVKYTPKGGKVTITAKLVPGHSVEISVRDTGIGMTPEMVDDLFRLDVQTNRKGTDGEPSSGLGLLLCKDFVEKHGGKIWVESEEGKGSTFCFTLPF